MLKVKLTITTNVLTAAIMKHTSRPGITAAAGTRVALYKRGIIN